MEKMLRLHKTYQVLGLGAASWVCLYGAYKHPVLGVMLCCCYLEILYFLKTSPIFSFFTGSGDYVAGLGPGLVAF